MTQVIEQVQPDLVDEDDDITHTVCCDVDVAACGRYIPGDDWILDGSGKDCLYCLYILENQLPCSIPGCPIGDTMVRDL